jgi:hypothetical protein
VKREESEGIPIPVQHFGQRTDQAIGVRRFYSDRKHLESKEGAGYVNLHTRQDKIYPCLKSAADKLDEKVIVYPRVIWL